MVRILVFLILAVVIARILKRMLSDTPRMQPANPSTSQPAVAFTPIAACAVCGVHIPLAESVAGGDGYNYCCDAHRNQANGQGR
jgi:uncharacterized protein